jgi:acyl-CoA synthetase (AMP-forming)/AMP-acid ligase II
MPPAVFQRRPLAWLDAISEYRGNLSAAPNFAYDLCARTASRERPAQMDLSCWHVAANAGEPIRAATVERFARTFGDCHFKTASLCPAYGLAEATLFVSGSTPESPHRVATVSRSALARRRVVEAPTHGQVTTLTSCGIPPEGVDVAIVDPATHNRCFDDEVGEIWVRGGSVTAGYVAFADKGTPAFDGALRSGEGPFLRSGDLGFINRGHLFVTGRASDAIVIGGLTYYPHDIEAAVDGAALGASLAGLVVFGVRVSEQERLIVAAELSRPPPASSRHATLDSLARGINDVVNEQWDLRPHEVLLLRPGHIPKTSSHKQQRHLCRERYLDGGFDPVYRLRMD